MDPPPPKFLGHFWCTNFWVPSPPPIPPPLTPPSSTGLPRCSLSAGCICRLTLLPLVDLLSVRQPRTKSRAREGVDGPGHRCVCHRLWCLQTLSAGLVRGVRSGSAPAADVWHTSWHLPPHAPTNARPSSPRRRQPPAANATLAPQCHPAPDAGLN